MESGITNKTEENTLRMLEREITRYMHAMELGCGKSQK